MSGSSDLTQQAETYAAAFHGSPAEKFMRERHISLEVCRELRIGYDHSRRRLVIPYRKSDGTVALLKSRWRNGDGERQMRVDPTGLENPPPFNLPALAVNRGRTDTVLLLEGETDTLSALTHLPHLGWAIVGVPGLSGFRTEWAPNFDGYSEVLVCLDNDEDPGPRRQAERCMTRITEALPGCQCRRVFLPEEHKDLCEFFMEGGSVETFALRVTEARERDRAAEVLAKILPFRRTLNNEAGQPGQASSKPRHPSVADQLVLLTQERYELGCSVEGEPFGMPADGPRFARVLRGQGGSLRAELAAAYLEQFGKVASSSALADAFLVLEGLALREPRVPLYLRQARVGDALFLDLGDPSGRVVQITREGWSVQPEAPIAFRRTELTGALPRPMPGNAEEFRSFMNVSDEGWALILGWLVAAFFPGIPHVILALTGEQGAAKSTTARMLVDVVDPSPAPLRSVPRDIKEWATVAAASSVVGIDNLSQIPAWLSDALCRAVTGEGFPRRRLYSDGDIVVAFFRRTMVLTGIELGALSGDLVDRTVFVELERIPPTRRRLDEDLAKDFLAARPRILGGVLDLVAVALDHLAEVQLSTYPRMADHARVLAALDQGTGRETLPAYLRVSDRALEEAIEGDQVASRLAAFMESRTTWSGSASELLGAISPEQAPKGWPTTAHHLSGRVTRAAPMLRAAGLGVSRGSGSSRRTITIAAVEVGAEAPPAPSVGSTSGDDAPESASPERHRSDTASSLRNSSNEGIGDADDAHDAHSRVISADREHIHPFPLLPQSQARRGGPERHASPLDSTETQT